MADELNTSGQLRRYLALFVPWVWLIALCTALAMGGTYLVTRMQRPVYRANALLIVNVPNGGTPVYTSQVATMYAQMVTQPVVMSNAVTVAKLKGVSITATNLTSTTQASSPSNTSLISVSVDDVNATRAAVLANAVSTGFITTLNEQGLSDIYAVAIFQPAVPPPTPDHPSPIRNALIGGAFGLALALVLVHFLIVADRQRLSARERLEEEAISSAGENGQRPATPTGEPANHDSKSASLDLKHRL